MTQLVVKTYNETAGHSFPAYAVCVADGRATVKAVREEWKETARRVEAALNAARPWERPTRFRRRGPEA